MTFGEKISLLRKNLKWSQDELAKKAGTSAPIIGRYERNEIKPSIEVAVKIATELEVTLDYLVAGGSLKVLDRKTRSSAFVMRFSVQYPYSIILALINPFSPQ